MDALVKQRRVHLGGCPITEPPFAQLGTDLSAGVVVDFGRMRVFLTGGFGSRWPIPQGAGCFLAAVPPCPRVDTERPAGPVDTDPW